MRDFKFLEIKKLNSYNISLPYCETYMVTIETTLNWDDMWDEIWTTIKIHRDGVMRRVNGNERYQFIKMILSVQPKFENVIEYEVV